MALITEWEVTDIMLAPGELIKIRASVVTAPEIWKNRVKAASALSAKDNTIETLWYIWIK